MGFELVGIGYARAAAGRVARMSGYSAAMHEALKRVARAPFATGISAEVLDAQV